jgi:hypothetical protein
MEESENEISGLHLLPVLDWEIAEQRKIIPGDLQRIIGASTRILRVPADVHEKETTGKHRLLVNMYYELSRILVNWEYWCSYPEQNKWRIMQIVEDESGKCFPLLTVIGKDRNESHNLISMHRRDDSYFKRLLDSGDLRRRG